MRTKYISVPAVGIPEYDISDFVLENNSVS